ncbi:tetratricopeptide repeat protein [Flammeovirga agarivorans]|uniref:Tetratricopeptide repeat protein n=1 Tax=Flammeovirga agarivorans TaxID=2726742 RepID=A0A7X8XWI9_9BACT|nr:tetratricopeptide repeat protein [Flammeovirga agarivorans]NLR92269.1 tetratricopeptide repeat protein [Flammeovirga agarivorans]
MKYFFDFRVLRLPLPFIFDFLDMNIRFNFIYIILLLNGLFSYSFAQETLYFSDTEKQFNKGIVLFNENNFSAARRSFQQFMNTNCGDNEKCIEAEYYVAVCHMELDHPQAELLITDFTQKYPVHPYAIKAYKVLGSHYFEKGDYQKALDAFNKDPYFDFYDDQDIKIAYQAAYSNFDQGNYKEANKLFQVLKKGTHPYATKSSYYSGFIEYEEGDYETAEVDLEKAANDPDTRDAAYNLLPLVYYKLGKVDKMLQMVAEAKANNIHLPADALLFAGKVHYGKKNYPQADIYFSEYLKEVPLLAVDRITSYQIGNTKYNIGDKRDALPFLSNAADYTEKDELAQVAAYDLGVVALSTGDKDKAMIGFEQAHLMDFDMKIKELSSYNFCKILFDLELYAQVPRACDYFLAYFPNSEMVDEINNLMNVSYVNSGDYSKAIKILERKSSLTEAEQKAYQEAAYNKAVELANDNNESEAVVMLRKSQRYPINQDLLSASNFWLGEAYSALGVYDTAALYYKRVPENSEMYLSTLYGIGYVQYADEEYEAAINNLTNYINNGRTTEPRPKVIEAIVRRADCYFGLTKYEVANRSYDMAISYGAKEKVYINYQKAQILRAKGMKTDAYRSYKSVASADVNSPFAPLSLYHAAGLLQEEYKFEEAVKEYSLVIDKYKQSAVFLPSVKNRALCYATLGNLSAAEEDYKYLIDDDPTSEYADNAIRALQDLNNGAYAVTGLEQYKQKFKEANPESNATLVDDYNKAMKPYLEKDYSNAIYSLTNFITNIPSSKYSDDIYFALGVSYKFQGQFAQSIEAFHNVQHMPSKEKALLYVGDLEIQEKKYNEAINTYNNLEKIATRKAMLWAVYNGLMEAHFAEKDYEASKAYANKIIDQKIKRYELKAYLYLAKVDLENKNFSSALTSFNGIAAKASSSIGAEAQYLEGDVLRQIALQNQQGINENSTVTEKENLKKEFEESTQALLLVQKNFASYADWTSKAYLLIAENYISIDDLFNAKATLESVRDYTTVPGDKQLAIQRLMELQEIKLQKSAVVAPSN